MALKLIVPPDHIGGLALEWVSGTSVRLGTGQAFVPGLAEILEAPNPITLAGLALTVNAWHYAYLYRDGSGNPALELSATAPAAPYRGTARTKTGDAARRYLGQVLTDGAGAVRNFRQAGNAVYYVAAMTAAPFRVVADAAAKATMVEQSLAAIVPPEVAQEVLLKATLGTASGTVGAGFVKIGLNSDAAQFQVALSGIVNAVNQYITSVAWSPVLPTAPSVWWANHSNTSVHAAGMKTSLDVTGYRFAR